MIDSIVKRLLENHRLDEMAYSRKDALILCSGLGDEFIEHFQEIYREPDKVVVSHWCDEMNAWFHKVDRIILSTNKKKISDQQITDWFLLVGSSTEILFKDPQERGVYEQFIRELLNTREVKSAMVNINLVDEWIFKTRKEK